MRQDALGYDPYPAIDINSTAALGDFDLERVQLSLNTREYGDYFSSLNNFWDFFSEAKRAPFTPAGGVRARLDIAEFNSGLGLTVATAGSYDPLQLIGGLVMLRRLGFNEEGLTEFAVQSSVGAWGQAEVSINFGEAASLNFSLNPDGKNLVFVLEDPAARDTLTPGAKTFLILNPALRAEWSLE